MTQVIVTVGPATDSLESLEKLKLAGVDFVRVNMSHADLKQLSHFISLSKAAGVKYILDTEGSQVRTGAFYDGRPQTFSEGDEIALVPGDITEAEGSLALRPAQIISGLNPGDLLYIDFGTLILQVVSIDLNKRRAMARAITGGTVGGNKGVAVDAISTRAIELPTLSPKDCEAIRIGLSEGVEHIAASFMRSSAAVQEVREATEGKMKIISKVECLDALKRLDEIIAASDAILIDRGDLSKEIPIEKIPFVQKIIIHKARTARKPVFVATNLLESMVDNPKPTRAEVHDIVATLLDGASGLTLAAETAIGKYPLEAVKTMQKIIAHASSTAALKESRRQEPLAIRMLAQSNYALDEPQFPLLIPPHGGRLVNRILEIAPEQDALDSLAKITLDEKQQMDLEQIAVGTYSPLEGFMNKADFESVRDHMRLARGSLWPLPIILDINEEQAGRLRKERNALLCDEHGDGLAILDIEDIFSFDKKLAAERIYGTTNEQHPGVRMMMDMQDILIGGKISLIHSHPTEMRQYALTPRQVRRLFEERGWSRIVGFHTRNVIHRSHEFIQMQAMEKTAADGIFVHPVIGKKKTGDYHTRFIVAAYEAMIKNFYPKAKALFAAYSTFSRYAGPREALFTALCRKNFGCSHFIVGRDHTGVGDFYAPMASHDIFDQFPQSDIGIEPIRFGKVFYSQARGEHVHELDAPDHPEVDIMHISGTEARKIFELGQAPPDWFMRPEISKIILDALKNGEKVFV
jgi:pyruvate kinase